MTSASLNTLATQTIVTSWGRLDPAPHTVVSLHDRGDVASALTRYHPGIAFGMGRSYGDACLNPGGAVWTTAGLDRFIAFDDATGRLTCEAGVLLRDIQHLMNPRGWMLPVTPGTQLITVGGAIANDVHGKNHHVVGSFGNHVSAVRLQRTDGEIIDCGPDLRADWFAATVGGIGLSGVIVQATLQLRPFAGPRMMTEAIVFPSLDEFFALADTSEANWEHTVAWIDCLSSGPAGKGAGSPKSRGIFMRGNQTTGVVALKQRNRRLTMPAVPISLINRFSLRLFNSAYYQIHRLRAGPAIADTESFLYPLDNLREWNRMYGPKGFFQYQCLVPRAEGAAAVGGMLEAIARSGEGSFLAVLKTFGNRQPVGMLSFPKPGVTLALDFRNQGTKTLRLLDRLDAIVAEARGRLYLAKDARMPRSLFEAGYLRHSEFAQYRDPGISSAMSRRLLGG